MKRTRAIVIAATVGASAFAGGWAQAPGPDVPAGVAGEEAAQALVEAVVRPSGGAGGAGLGQWTRSVIEGALERAGGAGPATGTASPAPALAEQRNAARTLQGWASRGNGAEVIVFTSLVVPAASWRQWAREAARIGAPLVLRGVERAGLRATVGRIGERLEGHDAGVAIDPRLFRLLRIERVPAVVVVPGGVPPCTSRGCAGDAPPPFDLVTGNIGLAAALETIAAEGAAGRDTARRELARLRGATR